MSRFTYRTHKAWSHALDPATGNTESGPLRWLFVHDLKEARHHISFLKDWDGDPAVYELGWTGFKYSYLVIYSPE